MISSATVPIATDLPKIRCIRFILRQYLNVGGQMLIASLSALEGFHQFALTFGDPGGDHHMNPHQLISPGTVSPHPHTPEAKDGTRLRTWRYIEFCSVPLERTHPDSGSEDGLSHLDRNLRVDVRALGLEEPMRLDASCQNQIPRMSSPDPRIPLSVHVQSRPVLDTGRYVHRDQIVL